MKQNGGVDEDDLEVFVLFFQPQKWRLSRDDASVIHFFQEVLGTVFSR